MRSRLRELLREVPRTLLDRATAVLLELLMFGLFFRTASALPPSRTIKQFDHTSWTVRQGAPSGIVALAQTTDGYLWLGTGKWALPL